MLTTQQSELSKLFQIVLDSVRASVGEHCVDQCVTHHDDVFMEPCRLLQLWLSQLKEPTSDVSEMIDRLARIRTMLTELAYHQLAELLDSWL